MEKEPTITELLSQIKLMEQALIFYADEKNYNQREHVFQIEKDSGSLARFTLKQLKTISDYEKSILDQISMLNDKIKEEQEHNPQELIKLVSEMKQLQEDINNKNL